MRFSEAVHMRLASSDQHFSMPAVSAGQLSAESSSAAEEAVLRAGLDVLGAEQQML